MEDPLVPFYPFAPPGSVAVLTSGGSAQSLSVPDAHGTVTASLVPNLYVSIRFASLSAWSLTPPLHTLAPHSPLRSLHPIRPTHSAHHALSPFCPPRTRPARAPLALRSHLPHHSLRSPFPAFLESVLEHDLDASLSTGPPLSQEARDFYRLRLSDARVHPFAQNYLGWEHSLENVAQKQLAVGVDAESLIAQRLWATVQHYEGYTDLASNVDGGAAMRVDDGDGEAVVVRGACAHLVEQAALTIFQTKSSPLPGLLSGVPRTAALAQGFIARNEAAAAAAMKAGAYEAPWNAMVEAQVAGQSVKQLKTAIRMAGMSYQGLREKKELRAKATEALGSIHQLTAATTFGAERYLSGQTRAGETEGAEGAEGVERYRQLDLDAVTSSYVFLGAMMAMHDRPKAIELLGVAAKRRPQDHYILSFRSAFHAMDGNFAPALEDLKDAAAICRGDLAALEAAGGGAAGERDTAGGAAGGAAAGGDAKTDAAAPGESSAAKGRLSNYEMLIGKCLFQLPGRSEEGIDRICAYLDEMPIASTPQGGIVARRACETCFVVAAQLLQAGRKVEGRGRYKEGCDREGLLDEWQVKELGTEQKMICQMFLQSMSFTAGASTDGESKECVLWYDGTRMAGDMGDEMQGLKIADIAMG